MSKPTKCPYCKNKSLSLIWAAVDIDSLPIDDTDVYLCDNCFRTITWTNSRVVPDEEYIIVKTSDFDNLCNMIEKLVALLKAGR